MKTIEISDEDHKALMELTKELQEQSNHMQAFPYFWEPASERLKINCHDEGEEVSLHNYDDSCSYSPEEYAEQDSELYEAFLRSQEVLFCKDDGIQSYDKDLETEWIEYVLKNNNCERYSQDWKQKTEHNPSLFLSDAQGFIKKNKHHLGRNPHTYGRSVWRMPKMMKLLEIIIRINPQPKNKVNHEAARFVFKNKG